MLRLPPFRFLRPRSLDEAARLLVEEGAAEGMPVRLVAGGTDLWPNMKRRHQKAETVISLMAIPALAGIRDAAPGEPEPGLEGRQARIARSVEHSTRARDCSCSRRSRKASACRCSKR